MSDLQLPQQQKRQARRHARSCWIRSGGDIETAKALFEAEASDVGIDPSLIVMAIYYAVRLFILWKSKNNKQPKLIPQHDEPYFSEDDVEIKTSQQLYAALASEFRPTAGTNQLSIMGIAVDVINVVLKRFVGSKTEAMAVVKKFWDEVVVPYDVPGVGAFIEAQLERIIEPIVMKAAEQILDSLELR